LSSFMHVPGFVALQETPGEFLALLGEAPAFQGLPKVVELTRSRAQKILHPSTAQADGDAAAAADGDKADTAVADAMQQDGDAQGGDADAADGGDAAQQQGEEAGAMDVDKAADGQQEQQDGGEGQQQQQAEQQDPIAAWSGRLQGVLQARFNVEHKPFTLDQVLLWMEQEQVRVVPREVHDLAKLGLDSMHCSRISQDAYRPEHL
jgi:hypothetical protein